jgi:hypothetical protein
MRRQPGADRLDLGGHTSLKHILGPRHGLQGCGHDGVNPVDDFQHGILMLCLPPDGQKRVFTQILHGEYRAAGLEGVDFEHDRIGVERLRRPVA